MFRKFLIATLALSSLTAFAKPAKVEVNPATSKLAYLAKKVTGEHSGEIKLASGFLNFDGANLVGGEFVIDMTTISCTDITDKDYNKKFLDHMNSDDFFSTATHKTATIVITSAKKVKGDNYTLSGDLTIKGKTAPITFEATVTKNAANAIVKFDRTTYDIKYGSGKFFQNLGDKMINDEVQLTVALATKK